MKTILIAALVATTVHAQSTNRWLTRPAALRTGAKDFVQYPDTEARAKHEMEVAFFCDVDKDGKVTNFQLYRPTDTNNVFVGAVRKALSAATFEPAISAGEPVAVQIGAAVAFEIQNGWPTPVVRLNVSDKSASERDYTGPQLVGGQAALLHNVVYPDIARAQRVNGVVDLAFDIDVFGSPRGLRVVNETPAGHGFGDAAIAAVRRARFIPALYKNHALKAPSSQRIEFNIEVIERYAPTKKKT